MHITITSRAIGSEHIQTINARELHAFLESKQEFSAWIKNRIEQYGFAEDVDFCLINFSGKEGRGGHNRTDYHISLDMAKELAMVERNDKGREARRYFIECERRLNSQSPAPALATPLTADLAAIEMVARFLNVSESSKVSMAKVAMEHHAPHLLPALPAYTIDAPLVAGSHGESSLVTKSLSALLKEHGIVLSAIKANKALEAAGFQERLARKSRKDPNTTKQFWSVTEAGLEYGKNVTSPSNPLETQPHWYAAKFPELIELSGMDKF